MPQKQFDLSSHKVVEELQGAELASFAGRATAYAVDWILVALLTSFFWLIIPAAALLIILKGKTRKVISKGSEMLRENLNKADSTFDQFGVEKKLKQRFQRYMTAYVKILIYAPLVISILVLLVMISNWISQDTYHELRSGVLGFENRFSSLKDMINGFNWALGIFNGFLYFSLFTWKWKGQTPGKRMLRVRVVKLNGRKISFYNSIERFSGYTASTSLLLWGFFQFFWDKNHQTTHDKISETVVIKN